MISSRSPALFTTVHNSSVTVSVQGGLIQLSGLYEPPSECTSTDPSAFTSSNRVAEGRWAVSRPT